MAFKKVLVASAAVAGMATVLVRNEDTRNKVKKKCKDVYSKFFKKAKNKKGEEQIKIAHSHPHDIEDNKMIGEGAMTSIQYYNDEQQERYQK